MGCCSSKEILPHRGAVDKSAFVFHSKGNPRETYNTLKLLGQGGFGTVRLVQDKRTGFKRAMKELLKSGLSEEDKRTMLKEVTTLSTLDHPNIMKVFELIESNTAFNIITEVIEGGELFDMISREKKLSEAQAVRFLYETMSAVSYCHANGIVHRDLKPQNLMLTSKNADASIKVIDFGIADKLNANRKITEVIGTPPFMSPEMFEGRYDEKCDIWSSGVILFMMITGTLPFDGRSVNQIRQAARAARLDFNQPVWIQVSSELKDLLRKMLDPNPVSRLSAKGVLDHALFGKLKAGSLSDTPLSTETLESLQKYNAQNKLEKSILTFISTNIIDDEANKELILTFKAIDKNNDGRLSKEEIIKGYAELGMSLEHAQEVISKIDSDQSGLVDYSEFITATQNWKKVCQKDVLEKTFAVYDIGGDGNLSLSELKQLIPGVETDEWNKFFTEADKNGDGMISLAEFKEYMLGKLA